MLSADALPIVLWLRYAWSDKLTLGMIAKQLEHSLADLQPTNFTTSKLFFVTQTVIMRLRKKLMQKISSIWIVA